MWAGPGGAARRAVPGVWGQRERGGGGGGAEAQQARGGSRGSHPG